MTIHNFSAPDGILELQINGKTFLRAAENTDGLVDVTLSADWHDFFDTAKGERVAAFKGLQFFMRPDAYTQKSGSPGDICLPNNSAYRMTSPDGQRAEPLVKLTNEGLGVPEFGRFRVVVPSNEAIRIDRPIGFLVVVDQTQARVGVFLAGGSAGWITKVWESHSNIFSTQDNGALINVWWYGPDNQYQIQNRSGQQLGISWAVLGGL